MIILGPSAGGAPSSSSHFLRFSSILLSLLFLLSLPSLSRSQTCTTGYSYQFYGADFRFNVSSQQVIGARVGPRNGDTDLPFPFRATEYTVEVWVKPYFATHYNYDGIVTTLWNTGSFQSGYGFYYDACGVNWWVASPSSSQAPNQMRFWLPRNKWSYLVGTLNATYMHKVFLNGKLVMQKQRNNPTVYSPQNLLYFGRYLDDDQDFGFNGELDGIRIWNRAWTDAEVATNYDLPVSYAEGTPNLLGAWDFEAGSGLSIADRSGNGWGATIFGPTGLGDQRPPTTLPSVQNNQASSAYWIPQNCSPSTDACNWCVPSKIDLSSAPATSTVDYTFRRTSFSWADPILNGHSSTQIASTQTNSVAIQIGFNFTYFGTAYDKVNVDKNGVLLFYAQDQLCDSDPLTSPGMPHPNGISVLWAQNINVNNPVKLYYTTSGEAGNRRFVITWYQVTPFIDPKTNRTFQAKLYENGRMEFQYLTMDLPDPYNQGAYSTIGVCQGIGWDVPITQGRCRLYREGNAAPFITTQSGLIVCNTNDNSTLCNGVTPSPAVNGTATDSSAAGALIGGILGGLLGFLFLLLVLLLASMVVYLAYRRWKDKQITYIREDQESHRNNLTTRYREIDWSELDLMELLGAGAFGKVYKGKWRGATVAVKVCTDFQLAMMTADTIENIRQEACLMELLGNHPNVISFVGAVTKGDYFALVTEYCPYGSMYDLFIAKKTDLRKPVTREMLIKMLRDAARGILHLHSEHVIHRDISARNMLVAKDTTVRVTDFGLSRLRQDTEESYATTKSNVGPVKWMAPEAITKRIYSEKSDSWSFGVLVWEMVTQNEPWQNVALLDIAIGVGRKGWTLKIPKNCDPFFKRLMKDCWKQQPEKRPSFQEIEARLSAELGDDSEESTVESDPEEEDVPSLMKKKRDDYELRSDHVADFELDEMEAAAAGKAAKKKKKNRKRRRMSRKNDGLDALRGVGGVSHEAGLLEASTTTTTTAAVSPYGDVSSTAMMGGDNLNSLDEASDESGKDFKEHL